MFRRIHSSHPLLSSLSGVFLMAAALLVATPAVLHAGEEVQELQTSLSPREVRNLFLDEDFYSEILPFLDAALSQMDDPDIHGRIQQYYDDVSERSFEMQYSEVDYMWESSFDGEEYRVEFIDSVFRITDENYPVLRFTYTYNIYQRGMARYSIRIVVDKYGLYSNCLTTAAGDHLQVKYGAVNRLTITYILDTQGSIFAPSPTIYPHYADTKGRRIATVDQVNARLNHYNLVRDGRTITTKADGDDTLIKYIFDGDAMYGVLQMEIVEDISVLTITESPQEVRAKRSSDGIRYNFSIRDEDGVIPFGDEVTFPEIGLGCELPRGWIYQHGDSYMQTAEEGSGVQFTVLMHDLGIDYRLSEDVFESLVAECLPDDMVTYKAWWDGDALSVRGATVDDGDGREIYDLVYLLEDGVLYVFEYHINEFRYWYYLPSWEHFQDTVWLF